MARRLVQDAHKERAEQERLQARIGNAARKALQSEIRVESERIIRSWELIGILPGVEDHQRRAAGLIDQMHAVAIRVFASRVEEQLKSATPRHLKASGADLYERLVAQYMATRGGLLIADDIAQATKRQIARMIATGLKNGLSNAEIVKNVRSAIPVLSQARAAVIARTEVHSAANYAHQEAAVESGLVTAKEWVATQDARTRDEEFDHVEADGQIVLLSEPFIVSGEALMYPGDPAGSAGNTINCRCGSVFIVDD